MDDRDLGRKAELAELLLHAARQLGESLDPSVSTSASTSCSATSSSTTGSWSRPTTSETT